MFMQPLLERNLGPLVSPHLNQIVGKDDEGPVSVP